MKTPNQQKIPYDQQEWAVGVIAENHQKADFRALDNARILRTKPRPLSPHHSITCLTCCDDGESRGRGVIRVFHRYVSGDGEEICSGWTRMTCPDCNGHGWLFTPLGAEYARQDKEQRRNAVKAVA